MAKLSSAAQPTGLKTFSIRSAEAKLSSSVVLPSPRYFSSCSGEESRDLTSSKKACTPLDAVGFEWGGVGWSRVGRGWGGVKGSEGGGSWREVGWGAGLG